MGKKYGVTRGVIDGAFIRVAERRGIDLADLPELPKYDRGVAFTEEQEDGMRDLLERGTSVAELSRIHDCTRGIVRGCIRRSERRLAA